MLIEIDFEVFKALTIKRATEETSYNHVIRQLLGLPISSDWPAPADVATTDTELGVFFPGGRRLPDGTKLRASYKGKVYEAEVRSGAVLKGARTFKSLSAAARSVTGNSVNGLRFWSACRPRDEHFTAVIDLPKADRP